MFILLIKIRRSQYDKISVISSLVVMQVLLSLLPGIPVFFFYLCVIEALYANEQRSVYFIYKSEISTSHWESSNLDMYYLCDP